MPAEIFYKEKLEAQIVSYELITIEKRGKTETALMLALKIYIILTTFGMTACLLSLLTVVLIRQY